jgi:hypothetical protein
MIIDSILAVRVVRRVGRRYVRSAKLSTRFVTGSTTIIVLNWYSSLGILVSHDIQIDRPSLLVVLMID